jgi:transposase
MTDLPKQIFTAEFREEAVKLVIDQQLTVPAAAKRLGMSAKTLGDWAAHARKGGLSKIGESRQPVTSAEGEMARLGRELAEARMERDLLKKAAAYFASEPLRGTRS